MPPFRPWGDEESRPAAFFVRDYSAIVVARTASDMVKTGVFQFWDDRTTAFEFASTSSLLLEKALKYAFENSARRIFPAGEAADFGQKVATRPESEVHLIKTR